MASTNPLILTINGGSSSIKFALLELRDVPQRTVSGAIERIGQPQATLGTKSEDPADHASRTVNAPDHTAAVEVLMDEIQQRLGGAVMAAVGHRVVQGGPKYWAPQLITDALIEGVRRLFSFDPEHLPEEILLIEAVRRRFPDVPQIACFDTAFHHDLSRVAQLLAIPRRYEKQGVRRYGFHGLSYEFLMGELANQAGVDAAQGPIILAHLGSGASLAAVHHGKPVDTSMGFTTATNSDQEPICRSPIVASTRGHNLSREFLTARRISGTRRQISRAAERCHRHSWPPRGKSMPDQGKPVQLAIVGVGIGAAAGGFEALGLFGLKVKPHVPRWQTLEKKEVIA